MTLRLHRVGAGHYRTYVRIKGSADEPFELMVIGCFREMRNHREWVIESAYDDARAFLTLKEARAYIELSYEETAP